jgi:pimeloyl-ACP methyl ester carboxylesterase
MTNNVEPTHRPRRRHEQVDRAHALEAAASLPSPHDTTAMHRGGAGPPLVCLHGFGATWHAWEPVLPALERHHDVLAVTLAGHAGGPPVEGEPDEATLTDSVERAMDEAGFEAAHIVGHSIGGYVALQLAVRARARSVVAFAPAGGWASERDTPSGEPPDYASVLYQEAERSPQLWAVARSMLMDVGLADAAHALPLIARAMQGGWTLDAERIACPVRIAWGTEDECLPWPAAAARFRTDWLPNAEYVELERMAHCPHIEAPSATAQVILEFTRP